MMTRTALSIAKVLDADDYELELMAVEKPGHRPAFLRPNDVRVQLPRIGRGISVTDFF
jgi:hypothetical protein